MGPIWILQWSFGTLSGLKYSVLGCGQYFVGRRLVSEHATTETRAGSEATGAGVTTSRSVDGVVDPDADGPAS